MVANTDCYYEKKEFILIGKEGISFCEPCSSHGSYYCVSCILDSRGVDFKEEFSTFHIEPARSAPIPIKKKKTKHNVSPELGPRERFNSEGEWDSISVTEFNRSPLQTSEDEQD